jgi:hypothetical protein
MARAQADQGHGYRTGKFNDDMREYFGLVGEEVRQKLIEILDEVPAECYRPPYQLEEPPGHPFILDSGVLGREIYFKFQVAGTTQKPRVLFWSCHPPRYGIKIREI